MSNNFWEYLSKRMHLSYLVCCVFVVLITIPNIILSIFFPEILMWNYTFNVVWNLSVDIIIPTLLISYGLMFVFTLLVRGYKDNKRSRRHRREMRQLMELAEQGRHEEYLELSRQIDQRRRMEGR